MGCATSSLAVEEGLPEPGQARLCPVFSGRVVPDRCTLAPGPADANRAPLPSDQVPRSGGQRQACDQDQQSQLSAPCIDPATPCDAQVTGAEHAEPAHGAAPQLPTAPGQPVLSARLASCPGSAGPGFSRHQSPFASGPPWRPADLSKQAVPEAPASVLDGILCLGLPFGAPTGSGGGVSPRTLGGPTASDLSSLYSHSLSSTSVSLSRGSACPDRLTPCEADVPEELRGISLGPVVGSGAFGRVYRGKWRGASVAVKLLSTWVDPRSPHPPAPLLEALLSKKLNHPNLVQTLEHAIKPLSDAGEGREWWRGDADFESELEIYEGLQPRPADKQQLQTWIVQQYCDRGTLEDALSRGWLRVGRCWAAAPDMRAVLATALEVASALRYCHRRGVLHGDLTAGNVLLASRQRRSGGSGDPRDFVAKVGDFGLARILDPGEHQLLTRSCGTIGYMPLERIQDNLFTKAADVYSFGVLCWEMLTGRRAWAGRQPVQILYARTALGLKLELPADVPSCPPQLTELVQACLADEHTRRPTFGAICEVLAALLAAP